MARVNYQREKRMKDLERQRKQEEKRRRKLEKGQAPTLPGEEVEEDAPEATEAPATEPA